MAKTLTTSSARSDETDGLASFKAWWKDDREARDTWAEEAEKCFAFTAGDQWTEDERSTLEAQGRPCITFNRIAPIVDSVAGLEVNNRHETRYIPREPGDVKPNETLTAAAEWYRDVASAEEHDSDAFRDCIVAGMGWTDNRLDFEGDDPDGAPYVEKIDPFEMFWDHAARKANLADARRLWRVRRMPRTVAEEMFPDADPDDLDASGWCDPEGTGKSDGGDAIKYQPEDRWNRDEDDADKEVTIVHVQWRELQDVYTVAFMGPDGSPQSKDGLKLAEHKLLTTRLDVLGIQHRTLKQKRPVFRQAFLGRIVLEQPDMPRNGFTWACITGRWDQKKRVWYGIVRAMLDPQEWANKWLSQALHILNSNAKGGIMAEKDAFEDMEQARASWAAADRITFTKPGAITGGKIQPKPAVAMPQNFMELMQFAISSVRDTAGTSLELLGMADTPQQTGMVEESRKQSSMTVLATLFDSLRRYRKVQAKIILDYLKDPTFVNGRLFRVIGGDQESYQRLAPEVLRSNLEYDIIIDESASSPNQKEKTWEQLVLLFPVLKDRLSPAMILKLMEYSPIPSSLVEEVKQIAEQEAQQGPPPDPKVIALEKQFQIDRQRLALEEQQDVARQQREDARDVAMAARQAATEAAQRDAEIAAENAKTQQQMMLEARKAQFAERLKLLEFNLKAREAQHQAKMAELQARQARPEAKADKPRKPKAFAAAKGPDGAFLIREVVED